jgi:hypothetical protein
MYIQFRLRIQINAICAIELAKKKDFLLRLPAVLMWSARVLPVMNRDIVLKKKKKYMIDVRKKVTYDAT